MIRFVSANGNTGATKQQPRLSVDTIRKENKTVSIIRFQVKHIM